MDKREAILARLLIVVKAVEGIKTATRNKKAISEDQRPGVQIFDADEEADDREIGRGRPGNAPNLITMTPEIFLVLGAVTETVGTELNTLRAKLVKAIVSDSELATLVGPNGEIRYKACATGLSQGRTMEGEMGIVIDFKYVLNPSEL